MRKFENISYSSACEEALDAYLPEANGFTTVVYFHGGGLVSHGKSCESLVNIAGSFVKKGYAFVSVEYRIYPNAKFPEFIEDAAAAVAYVKKQIPDWGGNGKIIITGQSAGAWLSLMLCLEKKYLNAVGIDPLEIEGWIIDSAQTTAHFNVLKYELGEHPLSQRINEFAPQYFVNEATKFTKMLLIFYEHDMACRYEQNMLFYKSVLAFNKEADICYQVLPGGHCHGSSVKDDDGEYAYVKTAFRWLEEKDL
ncbi:MAG: alpha/beta hydrolase [Clostridia bacterium]|nr:alpha/beta hydrolase [Clostridia bacterium]